MLWGTRMPNKLNGALLHESGHDWGMALVAAFI
jgi:hypothetical protein